MTSIFRFQFAATVVLFVAVGAAQFVAVGAARAEEDAIQANRLYLVDGEVVDADTGEPIDSFRVLPGTPYRGAEKKDVSVAVWQPHMIREMTDGVFRWPRTRGYKEMRFRVEADGYRPATTNWLGVGGPYMRFKVHLQRDPGVKAVVRTPDGPPAVGATLAIGQPNRGVRLQGCRVAGLDDPPSSRLSDRWRRPQAVTTDANGQCVVPAESDPSAMLCVVHQEGYLEMPLARFFNREFDSAVELKLKRWARIRGKVIWKDKPGAGELVVATVHRQGRYPGIVSAYPQATAGDNGDYLLDFVPPGPVQVGHRVKLAEGAELSSVGAIYEYPVFHVDVRPGKTARVDFGGKGIVVTGRLQGIKSFGNVSLSISPPSPDGFGWVKLGNGGGAMGIGKGFAALRESKYAPMYFRQGLAVGKDGSFRIKDVMTGAYHVAISGDAIGAINFTATSFGENPMDLGTIQVKPPPKSDAE